MLPPLGTSPGSHRPTVSLSASRCSATSCSTTVATKVFVTLPTRTRSPAAMGVCVAMSARPLVATVTWLPWRASPIAPGTPSLTICWMAAWNADGAGGPARTLALAGAAPVARTHNKTTKVPVDAATMRLRALSPIGRPEDPSERDAGGCGEHRRACRIPIHELAIVCLLALRREQPEAGCVVGR